MERLQKVLAHAGIASRRASEALITQGRVAVNGRVVTELGARVDPARDVITVDGRRVGRQPEKPVYLILNKPRGVVSAVSDDQNRRTVLDLVDVAERVYPVGRLDIDSQGLILLTNDGELTQRLTHPRYRIEKEYLVLVTGNPSTETLSRWRRGGIDVEGRPAGRAEVEKLKMERGNTWLKVILTEGRKREIREIAGVLGHPVRHLTRVRIGPILLGNLRPGKWRYLTTGEVQRLKQVVGK